MHRAPYRRTGKPKPPPAHPGIAGGPREKRGTQKFGRVRTAMSGLIQVRLRDARKTTQGELTTRPRQNKHRQINKYYYH